MAQPGREAAIVFTRKGEATLDTSSMAGHISVRWLDIPASTWLEPQRVAGTDRLRLETPGEGMRAVVVKGIG
jgi:hypothetical protein